MSDKIHPGVAIAIGAAILVIIVFLGFKVFGSNQGAEGKPTIVTYDKNDEKFKPKLPSNMAGGQ